MSNNHNKKRDHAKSASSLHEEVMAHIAAKDMAPRPRWYFSLKNTLLWGSGLFLLIIGALSVSIIIFIVSGNAWEMRQIVGNSHLEHMIQIFPFLWLLAFVIFLVISDFIIAHTKGTYKHSSLKVSLAIIASSIVLGSIFYACRISSLADQVFGKSAPHLYKTLDQRRENFLHKPDKGRIMGIVQSIEGERFIIKDKRKNHELTIDGSAIPKDKYILVQVGQKILVIGRPGSQDVFTAFDVHPAVPKMRKIHRIIDVQIQQGAR